MSSESRLHEVANALLALLADEVSAIPWVEEIIGPKFPKETTGTLSCSQLTFKSNAEATTTASAVYNIAIIAPDPAKNASDPRYIESLALQVYAALQDSNLDGWADNTIIKRIIFGAAPGRIECGMALIEIVITFGMEE